MTIIQYVGTLGDGGAETLVKNYCLLLKENGHTPIVVTNYPPIDSANYKQLVKAGIEVVPVFEKFNLCNRLIYKLFKTTIFARRLLNVIRRFRPNALHIHMYNLEPVSAISEKIKGINLFYTCHSLPEVYLSRTKHKKEHAAAKYLIEHNNLQLISLHEDMRVELNDMFKINTTVTINNGIDFSLYNSISKEDENKLRREIGIQQGEFVMGHVGRFMNVKNHKFIIEVFYELQKVRQNSKLLLIGTGPLEEDIIKQASELGIMEKLIMLKQRTDVNKLLHLMDVFVFPSFYEGLSVALVEAQVAGLRCIVSDTVNKSSIITRDAITMSLKQSTKEWCAAILDHSKVNPAPGDITRFDLRNIIKQLENLYSNEIPN